MRHLDSLARLGGRHYQRLNSGGSRIKLLKIRRLVESGVRVKVEGTETVLTTWQDFYEWAPWQVGIS